MNIEKIRRYYDPERDWPSESFCPQVSWVEMELAEEVERLKNTVTVLSRHIYKLYDKLEKLEVS